MARFEDRVREIINDRVNDLERLFLTSEASQANPQMDECCQDVLRRVRKIGDDTDKILRELKDQPEPLKPEDRKTLEDALRPEPSGSPDDDEPNPVEMDDHVDPNGMPHSWKDFLWLLGMILNGDLNVRDWTGFLKWMWKMLPFLLRGAQLLPFLTFVASIWRGIQDAVNDAADRMDRREILSDLDKLKQKVDDLAKVIAEIASGMQPGSETSMLLDRLQELLNKSQLYYNALAELQRGTIRLLEELKDDVDMNFALLKSDNILLRSDIACVAEWLKGNRTCEEYEVDIYTLIDILKQTATQVRCNLDEYYAALSQAMAECCTTMQHKLDELSEGCERIRERLEGPDNPLDSIGSDLEQGNVVGTGSLVLQYANDLNAIKAQLADIRRLL